MRFLLFVILAVACSAQDNDSDSGSDEETRILGGSNAADGEFPYQVSLRIKSNNKLYHFCGGVIISPKWILSAAHCTLTHNYPADKIRVVTGTNKLDSGGDTYEVEKVITHEKYDGKSFLNDVEVLKLKKEIKFGDKVANISLASSNTPGGVDLIASGWGYTTNNRYGRQSPNDLQKLMVKSLSVKECQDSALKVYKKTNPIVDSQLCTYKAEGQGICQGDSGGPVVYKKEVVGLASWVISCARGRPDVFTRVFSFVDWIKKNTSE
ncbi:unnamed protein product [Leptosia nina]|uniref:trypsin n=1 Tax=Leptosia nina TaxID=320188 RepID=A0AAV1JGX1_9NEOP